MKNNHYQEWLRQADYDLDGAEILLKGGKYLHALFLCHLALEKSLKAAYEFGLKKTAPKIHNLSYLYMESGIKQNESVIKFLKAMSELNIVSRYPEELGNYIRLYTRRKTASILKEAKAVIKWIKEELEK